MSSVTTKTLVLSQPKAGQVDVTPTVILPHVITHEGLTTVIKIEVPGVDPSTVDVQFEYKTLRVGCERGELTVPVDPTVDASKIKADIQWGVLTLTVPAPAPPVSHNIKVSIHDATKSAPPSSKSKFTGEE